MKKKFLLTIIPALMVLAGCNPLSSYAAAGTKVGFQEDTLAHEELFGDAKMEALQLSPKRSPDPLSLSTPLITYQISYNSETQKLAIRFVAAIKETAGVKAEWRRGVAGANGQVLQSKDFSDDPRPSAKYYESLTSGRGTIDVTDDDEANPYKDYAGFVVYTLHNIPYNNANNQKAYVAAYLTISEEGNESNKTNSMALAVKIQKKDNNNDSANEFSFNPKQDGHFLQGVIDGSKRSGAGLWGPSGSTPDGCYAWYDNVTLRDGDSFGAFYYRTDEVFQFFGRDDYFGRSVDFLNEDSSLPGYNSPIKSGNYKIYVSNGYKTADYGAENQFTTKVSYFNESIDVWLSPSSNWIGNTNRYAVHYFDSAKNPADPVGWVSMTLDGEGIYKATIPAKYQTIIFCAMNKNTEGLTWDDKWNQTGNVSLSSMPGYRSRFVKSNDGWDYHANDGFVLYPEPAQS